MGTRTRATQPRRVLAQLTPRASNMYVAKRGKTAPKRERRKVFAAMAEAALGRRKRGGWVSKFYWGGGGRVCIGKREGAGFE